MDPLGAERVRAALEKAKLVLGEELEIDARGLVEGFSIQGAASASSPRNGSIIFLQAAAPEALSRFAGISDSLLILPAGLAAGPVAAHNLIVHAKNPKYAYALIASELFPLAAWRGELKRPIGPSSFAAEEVTIGENVLIEPFVTLGRGARIGAGTILMRGVSIGPSVEIGRDCLIKENAVIGDLGFGFAFDGERPPLRLPQLGGVRLGDRVEVGALSTIGAGTIEPTLIEDDVKISDHVHVAHNCRIGRASILTVGSTVSGSTRLGARVWLAPGATIRNKIVLGEGVTVGMGGVVIGDVAEGLTVVGVPAKPLGTTPKT